jgi:hypothetical protein
MVELTIVMQSVIVQDLDQMETRLNPGQPDEDYAATTAISENECGSSRRTGIQPMHPC